MSYLHKGGAKKFPTLKRKPIKTLRQIARENHINMNGGAKKKQRVTVRKHVISHIKHIKRKIKAMLKKNPHSKAVKGHIKKMVKKVKKHLKRDIKLLKSFKNAHKRMHAKVIQLRKRLLKTQSPKRRAMIKVTLRDMRIQKRKTRKAIRKAKRHIRRVIRHVNRVVRHPHKAMRKNYKVVVTRKGQVVVIHKLGKKVVRHVIKARHVPRRFTKIVRFVKRNSHKRLARLIHSDRKALRALKHHAIRVHHDHADKIRRLKKQMHHQKKDLQKKTFNTLQSCRRLKRAQQSQNRVAHRKTMRRISDWWKSEKVRSGHLKISSRTKFLKNMMAVYRGKVRRARRAMNRATGKLSRYTCK